ncbi:MAG: hypothetical protein KGI19_10535, partial [Thaumarchaeota archaeon]|nr:hypothetical protein [Nitrososphaerota archaeon]
LGMIPNCKSVQIFQVQHSLFLLVALAECLQTQLLYGWKNKRKLTGTIRLDSHYIPGSLFQIKFIPNPV